MGCYRYLVIAFLLSVGFELRAQFIDHFEGRGVPDGWVSATGDGHAAVEFKKKNGIASLHVDATNDTLNIWWALTRRRIGGLDMQKLAREDYELRVEAKIRVSHAPRRVNLHVNHQRTTDFHSHLMEFDIPDTTQWHVISMTTRDFETRPGDVINAHLALMDWGRGKYRVDFDYFRVDVVDRKLVQEDFGNPIPYHPPVAEPRSFSKRLEVMHDATIDTQFPGKNFDDWSFKDSSGNVVRVLATGGTQIIILKWDMRDYAGKKVRRSGLLELSPHTIQRSPEYKKDFGVVRICEIISGDPDWNEQSVTVESWSQGRPLDEVINAQMIIDDSVTWNKEGKVLFTISQPAMQRLIDGKTIGIAIKPLGAVNATFYTKEMHGKAPRLYVDFE